MSGKSFADFEKSRVSLMCHKMLPQSMHPTHGVRNTREYLSCHEKIQNNDGLERRICFSSLLTTIQEESQDDGGTP